MRPKRPASDLIDAVLDNMRQNLEPLKYSILAPSRYVVYLHPNEHSRLEGVLPRLRGETIRALEEELKNLNRRTLFRRWVARLARRQPPIQSAGVDWHIEFLCDPDGEIDDGDVLIDSALVLPAQPELGVGERTRRITTTRRGRVSNVENAKDITAAGSLELSTFETRPQPTVFARLSYDDRTGPHTQDVLKDSVTVGRGGVAYPVDIRVVSSEDVSREHARIRRDPHTGRFFLIDLSLLGTSLNGRHVPRGYDEVDGTKQENGAETPLPDRGRIGLADTLFLDFERAR